MTALEKHLSGLLHNSSNSILVCDNAKGSSFSDSNKSSRKPPASDSPRHHRITKKRRLRDYSDHFEAESRWESNEEQLFEKSPSCPLRSPDSDQPANCPLMALPDDCLFMSPGRRNELTKHRLIESMQLLRLDDSFTDVYGEVVTDLDP
jgi:hypothetical protein